MLSFYCYSLGEARAGVWEVHLLDLLLWRRRQEELEFKVSLASLVSLSKNIKKEERRKDR